jgi:hypothetical protein
MSAQGFLDISKNLVSACDHLVIPDEGIDFRNFAASETNTRHFENQTIESRAKNAR